jgi:GNAT superfamily N-acetyltransferase
VEHPRGRATNDMKTRNAAKTDGLAIAELTAQLGYSTDVLETEERLTKILAQADSAVYVAEDDCGAIIGWIQTHVLCSLESGLRVEIIGLIVAENARRRGVGRLLIRCAEEWTRATGANAMVVRSNSQRIKSHLFYPSLGFKHIKNQQVYRKTVVSE